MPDFWVGLILGLSCYTSLFLCMRFYSLGSLNHSDISARWTQRAFGLAWLFDSIALLGQILSTGGMQSQLLRVLVLFFYCISSILFCCSTRTLIEASKNLKILLSILALSVFLYCTLMQIEFGIVLIGIFYLVSVIISVCSLYNRKLIEPTLAILFGLYALAVSPIFLLYHQVGLVHHNSGLNSLILWGALALSFKAAGHLLVRYRSNISSLDYSSKLMADQKYLADKDLLGSMLHEIATPEFELSERRQYLEALLRRKRPPKEELSQAVKGLIDVISRIVAILNGTHIIMGLNSEQIDRLTGVAEFTDEDSMEIFGLNALVESALITVKNLFRKNRGKSFHVTVVANYSRRISIKGYKYQITQAFINVIKNAFEAMEGEAGSTLEITTRNLKDENKVEVTFRDNGVGMTNEVLSNATQLHYSTKVAAEGARRGNGLYLVEKIVNRHDGQLLIDAVARDSSHENPSRGGTTISITFPSA